MHYNYNHEPYDVYEHICSRNTLAVLDYKTEFNIKGQLTDKLDNGQLKGEFDLTLPTGHHFTGKVSIAVTLRRQDVFII
jgi:hypothetical protein